MVSNTAIGRAGTTVQPSAVRRMAPRGPVLMTAVAVPGRILARAPNASFSVSVPVSPITSISFSSKWPTCGSQSVTRARSASVQPFTGQPVSSATSTRWAAAQAKTASYSSARTGVTFVPQSRSRPPESAAESCGRTSAQPKFGKCPRVVRKVRSSFGWVTPTEIVVELLTTGHPCALSPKAAASHRPKPSSPMLAAIVKS